MMSAEKPKRPTGSLAAAFSVDFRSSTSPTPSPLLSPLRKVQSAKEGSSHSEHLLSVSPLKRSLSTGSDMSSRHSSPGPASPSKKSRLDEISRTVASSLAAAFGAVASPKSTNNSPLASPKLAPRSSSVQGKRDSQPGARRNLLRSLSAADSSQSTAVLCDTKSPPASTNAPSLTAAFGGAHTSRRGSNPDPSRKAALAARRQRAASDAKALDAGSGKTAEQKNGIWNRRMAKSEGFTVDRPGISPLKRVLSAHETKESGSSQDVLDEVGYILDGLRETESLTTRLHSMLSLADRCSDREFRMHLRAHGRIPGVVEALVNNIDRSKNGVRTLCAVNVIHSLTRDRLTAELGATCLPLLVSALNSDDVTAGLASHQEQANALGETASEVAQLKKVGSQVKKMLVAAGHDDCLDVTGTAPSVHIMAVQSIVELVKYSSDVRERMVPDGALEAVSSMAIQAVRGYLSAAREAESVAGLRMLLSCLSVIDNMTFLATDAPLDDNLIPTLLEFLKVTDSASDARLQSLDGHEQGRLLAECVLALTRVLLNLTNIETVRGYISSNEEHLQLLANCAIALPSRMASFLSSAPTTPVIETAPGRCEEGMVERIVEYDMYVHTLGLLVNLLEMCPENRARLANVTIKASGARICDMPLIDALAELFNQANEIGEKVSQRLAEGNGDAMLQQHQTETVVLSAYVAMVIAWLACDNRRNQLYIMHNVSAGRPHATLDQLVTRMTQFAHLHEVTGVAAMDSEQDHVRQALVILKSLQHMAE